MLIPTPYAIDIGDRTVRIAQLAPRRRWDPQHASPYFRTFAEQELAEGWMVDGSVREPAALAEFLRGVIARAVPWLLRSPHAVLTLPEARVLQTTISIPPDENSAAAVSRAVRAMVPAAADQAVVATQTVPGAADRLVVTVAPTDVVESYAALLRRFGITPIVCTTESDALARAVAFVFPQPQSYLILDLGATRTGAVIAVGPSVVASVTIPISGAQLTAAVAAKLKITLPAAERTKRAADLTRASSDDPTATVLVDALAPLNDEVRRLRTFAESHLPASARPTRIILTGGGAALTGLDYLLHEQTRLPVERFTLPDAVVVGLRAPKPAHTAHLATVFGLGLIALDPAAALTYTAPRTPPFS